MRLMLKTPMIVRLLLLGWLISAGWTMAVAQPAPADVPLESNESEENGTPDPEDQRIQERLNSIFAILDPLAGVEVEVRGGVVLLSGVVSNEAQAERAISLAEQIPGVLTVGDGIERRLDVQGNLTPMLEDIRSSTNQWVRALPLVGLAALIFFLVVYLGYALARSAALWRRMTTNPFLIELIGQAVRIASIVAGLVIALNLLGATALMATILGGAGVLGLAIGFAVRDTMENYISSIMLSVRQPFRANDHVVINAHEGRVVRLTSRATVLMTMDGNQLRIPNATVFKAVILNYTSNPQRRFAFELGVDAADDPIAAMKSGVDAMKGLSFVLADPGPGSSIKSIGDSNVVLSFTGWINQRDTDFGRARSLAIRAVTTVLDDQGFSMPEPIYRLRFDSRQDLPEELKSGVSAQSRSGPDRSARPAGPDAKELLDVKPDTVIEALVNEERALKNESDLLDETRPVE